LGTGFLVFGTKEGAKLITNDRPDGDLAFLCNGSRDPTGLLLRLVCPIFLDLSGRRVAAASADIFASGCDSFIDKAEATLVKLMGDDRFELDRVQLAGLLGYCWQYEKKVYA
jgi:hypothetical protein